MCSSCKGCSKGMHDSCVVPVMWSRSQTHPYNAVNARCRVPLAGWAWQRRPPAVVFSKNRTVDIWPRDAGYLGNQPTEPSAAKWHVTERAMESVLMSTGPESILMCDGLQTLERFRFDLPVTSDHTPFTNAVLFYLSPRSFLPFSASGRPPAHATVSGSDSPQCSVCEMPRGR